MNKVTSEKLPVMRFPEAGNIYVCLKEGDYYILGELGDHGYVAIGLRSGNRWHDVDCDIESAVDGLVFIGAGATITIETEK